MARSNWRVASLLILAVPLMILCGYGEVIDQFIRPFTLWTARIVLSGIRLLGIEAAQEGTIIRHGAEFAYEINGRCAGVVPLSLLAMAIIAANVSPGRKLAGAAIGLPVLFLVNWARLVSLFWLGVNEPQLFGFAHDVVWQVIMIVATVVTWLAWRSSAGDPLLPEIASRSDGCFVLPGVVPHATLETLRTECGSLVGEQDAEMDRQGTDVLNLSRRNRY